jgi:general secretion pathway protein G
MRIPNTNRNLRLGFTLIELLIVVAIIGVLVGLLLSAVAKVRMKAYEVQTRNDISQLSQAIGSFKVQYNLTIPFPSRIRLYETNSTTTGYDVTLTAGSPTNQLEYDSAQFLGRMFPRAPLPMKGGTTVWIDWNGNGAMDTGHLDLEGEECLVFFLGGIPKVLATGVICTGFSTNPSDPSYHTHNTPAGDVVPPLFDFPSARLTLGPSGHAYVFLDSYGTGMPYAYFSSYKSANGYNRYYYDGFATNSDCASLTAINASGGSATLWPYASSMVAGATPATPPTFLNPTGFQIISAGKDGLFAPGSDPTVTTGSPVVWSPTSASMVYDNFVTVGGSTIHNPGFDDMSNFYDHLLGIPP